MQLIENALAKRLGDGWCTATVRNRHQDEPSSYMWTAHRRNLSRGVAFRPSPSIKINPGAASGAQKTDMSFRNPINVARPAEHRFRNDLLASFLR
jgi:hypothetical protein